MYNYIEKVKIDCKKTFQNLRTRKMANTIRYVTSQHESIIFITLRIYFIYIELNYFNKTPIISKVESFYAILLVPGYSRN